MNYRPGLLLSGYEQRWRSAQLHEAQAPNAASEPKKGSFLVPREEGDL
jgi:hypothetical protein